MKCVPLLQRRAECAVETVLQIQLAPVGHHVGEQVAVERRVLLQQGVQIQGALRGSQLIEPYLLWRDGGPLLLDIPVVRIRAPFPDSFEYHPASLAGRPVIPGSPLRVWRTMRAPCRYPPIAPYAVDVTEAQLNEELIRTIREGYAFDDQPVVQLGVLREGEPVVDAPINIPLRMFNRHGLVAGATGTGKTKTLQVMAEALSKAGVPVFAPDIKGDLSGMAFPGDGNERLLARAEAQGQDWSATAFPCEFFSLGGQGIGVPVRASVTSFGPLLLAKVLGLNQVQESSLSLVFYYADRAGLPLLDLKDLVELLRFLISDDGKSELRGIGGVSSATVGVILRNLITLAEQGGDVFFGEPEFDPADLLRVVPDGRGVVSLLHLPELAGRPAMFSTFLMWLLAELFQELPEVGDPEKPKLVFFFDEAHLLFKDASKAFLDSITQTVRLIRSKGIGLFFVTQTPKDVPGDVLAQLGSRVQHQLRAHTPNDVRALRDTVATYPRSSYDLAEVLQSLGTGEAVVTVMNPKGEPTPVARTRIWAPESSMDPGPEEDLRAGSARSVLMQRYGQSIDRDSAYEILIRRMAEGARAAEEEQRRKEAEASRAAEEKQRRKETEAAERTRNRTTSAPRSTSRPRMSTRRSKDTGLWDQIGRSPVIRDMARTASREFVRGIFGTGRRR